MWSGGVDLKVDGENRVALNLLFVRVFLVNDKIKKKI